MTGTIGMLVCIVSTFSVYKFSAVFAAGWLRSGNHPVFGLWYNKT